MTNHDMSLSYSHCGILYFTVSAQKMRPIPEEKEHESWRKKSNKCSKKGKTLVIIQDTNNKIFGGFTNIEWEWNANWMDEGNKNTFLFSYIEDERIVKCKC